MLTQTITLPADQISEVLDAKRAVFQARIMRNFLTLMLQHKGIGDEIRGSAILANQSARTFELAAVENLPESTANWLENELPKDKLNDIAMLIETTMRIGLQEKHDIYEEFFSLIVELVDAVFYAQSHRKSLHFGKYKALFKLISNEIRCDTNKEPGQVYFRKNEQYPLGELFLRTSAPENKEEVK